MAKSAVKKKVEPVEPEAKVVYADASEVRNPAIILRQDESGLLEFTTHHSIGGAEAEAKLGGWKSAWVISGSDLIIRRIKAP